MAIVARGGREFRGSESAYSAGVCGRLVAAGRPDLRLSNGRDSTYISKTVADSRPARSLLEAIVILTHAVAELTEPSPGDRFSPGATRTGEK